MQWEVINFFVSDCSEMSNGIHLHTVCCDKLLSGGILHPFGPFSSCDDHVLEGEYVRNACPKTCNGK